MPVSSSTEHWIKPDALTINLNHFGDPDYLQVSLLAGAVVMAFKQDVIGYNAAHNYRTWPLDAANTYLETSSAYNVYARLTRSEVNARALVIYDPILRDVEGREITYEKNEETGEVKEILGEPNENFYFIFLGQLSSSISENGRSVLREWTSEYRSGSLETNEQQNDWMAILNKMFRPHYDDPLNPDSLTWIEAKAHMGIAGGLTSFLDNGSLKLPSIYDGLPIDNQTLYWEEVKEEVGTDEEGNPIYNTTKVLKAAGGGGTGGGSVNWDDIKDEISKNYVSSNNGNRMIWGQPLSGTSSITGELNLGTSGLLRKSSPYNDYDNIRIEMLERVNNYPPRLSIQASDYNGISPQGFISIGGIEDKMLQHLYILSLTTDVWGKLKLIADGEALGNTAKGIEMYVGSDKVLNIDAASGLKVSKFFYDGVDTFNLNNGVMKYNKDEGYWMFDGNLVVTGGLTTFADSGAGNQWIMDAETLEEVTSKNEFKVYSAKVTSMIASSISDATTNASDAITKLNAIKTAFNSLSSSSSASAIGGALKTLANNL